MSEIFDFLKKTEAERRKKASIPDPAADMPKGDWLQPENTPEPVAEDLVPVDIEICKSESVDLVGATPQLKSVLDPLTLVGEQFRLLRSRLDLMQKQRGTKIILVTSTIPEEGKTFTSSCLAGVFAQEPGKRVVLIDADMRKPRSGWSFGLNGSVLNTGLSDVLRGTIQFQNALLRFTNPEFCFLPSGPLPTNPSELLSSPQLERTLRTAAENFDWVILDSPPVLSLSDTMMLAPQCDAVLLVLRANFTPSKLVKDATDRIGRDRICGVVINRQKQVHTSRYYYQYYYRGSKQTK